MVNLCCSRPQFASIPLSYRATAAIARCLHPRLPGGPSTSYPWRYPLLPPYKG
ncbi:hypothetical protein I550_1152 [Mycobacterium intracellulare 1956]|uniref:Uncharacterized protein n=1 Tax=Mycobacterium intracellulare 1956 TaxID=1299331 RepID=X8CRY0_MYCIT|nr:hypothetical protein I550_1152 [Mycobacterium intracellulare 1956]